jgi:glucokinase
VFPFVGEAEAAYGESVRRQLGREICVGDDIVTGGGLARLFTHLTGQASTPAEAAAQLADQPQVVEWFARFYGRASRNYALNVLARGGLYLAGGVAAKNPCLVEHPAFLQEFTRSVTHRELLAAIPIVLNSNEQSGVYGAALAAEQLLRGGAA